MGKGGGSFLRDKKNEKPDYNGLEYRLRGIEFCLKVNRKSFEVVDYVVSFMA